MSNIDNKDYLTPQINELTVEESAVRHFDATPQINELTVEESAVRHFDATPQIGELSVVGSQIEVNRENARLHDMYLEEIKNTLLNSDQLYYLCTTMLELDNNFFNVLNQCLDVKKYNDVGITNQEIIYIVLDLYREQYADKETANKLR